MWLISQKMEALYVELNKRVEVATSSYSPPGDFPQHIYSVLVAKNQKKIQSRCLAHELLATGFDLVLSLVVMTPLIAPIMRIS